MRAAVASSRSNFALNASRGPVMGSTRSAFASVPAVSTGAPACCPCGELAPTWRRGAESPGAIERARSRWDILRPASAAPVGAAERGASAPDDLAAVPRPAAALSASTRVALPGVEPPVSIAWARVLLPGSGRYSLSTYRPPTRQHRTSVRGSAAKRGRASRRTASGCPRDVIARTPRRPSRRPVPSSALDTRSRATARSTSPRAAPSIRTDPTRAP